MVPFSSVGHSKTALTRSPSPTTPLDAIRTPLLLRFTVVTNISHPACRSQCLVAHRQAEWIARFYAPFIVHVEPQILAQTSDIANQGPTKLLLILNGISLRNCFVCVLEFGWVWAEEIAL
jgi:hypothetical protein